MKAEPLHVLVLCTGNSARSILGEMLFQHLGRGRVQAYSAGSRPGGVVNPVALETLARHGVPCEGARSKSWDEFTVPGAPRIDLVVTVCDSAASEVCPIWPGHPATTHWTLPDPAHIEPLSARREAFEQVYQALHRRITRLLAQPIETLALPEVVAAANRIHAEEI